MLNASSVIHIYCNFVIRFNAAATLVSLQSPFLSLPRKFVVHLPAAAVKVALQ